MAYVRQKKQTRFYWVEIGFMLLGLLGLQPAIFSNFLSTSPNNSTAYAEPYHPNANYPTLESLKEWAAPHLASLLTHSQSAGPIQTQQGWLPVPVSMTNVPSTSPAYAASAPMQQGSYNMASYSQWPQNYTHPSSVSSSGYASHGAHTNNSYAYPANAQQQSAYMAQLHPHTTPGHQANWQNNFGSNTASYPQHQYQPYVNQQYANPQYATQPYATQPYANPQYSNQQSANPQFANQHYANQQFANQQYSNPQYSAASYGSSHTGGSQYGQSTYGNQGYPGHTNQSSFSGNYSGNNGYASPNAAAPWPGTFGYNTGSNGPNNFGINNPLPGSYPQNTSYYSGQQSNSAGTNSNWQRFQPPTNSYLVR